MSKVEKATVEIAISMAVAILDELRKRHNLSSDGVIKYIEDKKLIIY